MVSGCTAFKLGVVFRCALPARRVMNQENLMLYYALVFFIIAIVAAVFGFSGLAAGAAGIAKILFVVFIVMAIAAFVVNLVRGR